MNSTTKTIGSLRTRALLLIFSLLLGACDGGLFGTGTGSEDFTDIGTDAATAPQSPPTTDPAGPADVGNSEVDSEPASPPAEPGVGINDLLQLEFTNTDPGGLDEQPLLKIINISPVALNARLNAPLNQNVEALFGDPINATTSSLYVELPTGESNLAIYNTQTLTTLININSLNLGRGSVTTLLVHSALDTTGNEDQNIDVQALATRVTTTAPGMALVRLIQAAASASASPQGTFTLIPDDPDPGAAELTFNTIDEQDNATTGYQLVNPGDYLFVDSRELFDSQSLSLQPDSVYTLILTGDTDNVIYTEIDNKP